MERQFQANLSPIQTLNFSIVGAHHQKIFSDKSVQDSTYTDQAIIIHVKNNWKDQVLMELCPFAIHYIVYMHNKILDTQPGYSPCNYSQRNSQTTRTQINTCVGMYHKSS